jgi:hypothetical protein
VRFFHSCPPFADKTHPLQQHYSEHPFGSRNTSVACWRSYEKDNTDNKIKYESPDVSTSGDMCSPQPLSGSRALIPLLTLSEKHNRKVGDRTTLDELHLPTIVSPGPKTSPLEGLVQVTFPSVLWVRCKTARSQDVRENRER